MKNEEKLSPKALKKHEATESKAVEDVEDMPVKKGKMVKKMKKMATSDGYMMGR